MNAKNELMIPEEVIMSKIYMIRRKWQIGGANLAPQAGVEFANFQRPLLSKDLGKPEKDRVEDEGQ